MPVINLSISKIQEKTKKQLISSLTKAASEATEISEEKFIVFIDEYEQENIGISGKVLKELRK